MSSSKKIYNDLSNRELNFFFNVKDFYIIEDTLNFILFTNVNSEHVLTKLLQKFIFKTVLFSTLLDIKTLKFPIYVVFISNHTFFENLLVQFIFKTLNIIFFKLKKIILNLIDYDFRTFFQCILNVKSIHISKKFIIKLYLLTPKLNKTL